MPNYDKKTIAIVDYAMGNIQSVKKALCYVAPNSSVIITSDKNKLLAADSVVFPGQGAMAGCMEAISRHNLVNTIKKCASEKPFLGICLGLQLLFEHTVENNNTKGLAIIAGEVLKFPSGKYKIPHIGWNNVKQEKQHPLWYNIDNNSYFYSIHSYFIKPKSTKIISASTHYIIKFTSAITYKNIFAVQFHPEKSQKNGLQLLKNFSAWRV